MELPLGILLVSLWCYRYTKPAIITKLNQLMAKKDEIDWIKHQTMMQNDGVRQKCYQVRNSGIVSKWYEKFWSIPTECKDL